MSEGRDGGPWVLAVKGCGPCSPTGSRGRAPPISCLVFPPPLARQGLLGLPTVEPSQDGGWRQAFPGPAGRPRGADVPTQGGAASQAKSFLCSAHRSQVISVPRTRMRGQEAGLQRPPGAQPGLPTRRSLRCALGGGKRSGTQHGTPRGLLTPLPCQPGQGQVTPGTSTVRPASPPPQPRPLLLSLPARGQALPHG